MTIEEMRNHEWVVSWSGGKDSTATILKAIEYNIPIKKVVGVMMMWDETLSLDLPEVVDFKYKTAERLRNEFGLTVELVPSIKTFMQDTTQLITTRSKKENAIGKPNGIVSALMGKCHGTTVKTNTVKKHRDKDDLELIGITIDEPKRLARLEGKNKYSLLATLNLTQEDSYKICEEYNMLSPVYTMYELQRDGCFVCPNARKAEREYIKNNHPELFEKIVYMYNISGLDLNRTPDNNNWKKDVLEYNKKHGIPIEDWEKRWEMYGLKWDAENRTTIFEK